MVYVRLFILALIPSFCSLFVYIIQQKTKFKTLSYRTQQIIIGIIFGGLSIMGTECGIIVPAADNAVINVRDAAPIAAGLIFGAPAGIIAGFLGGIERWFAVYWGAGYYSRLACSVATICSGIFAGALRIHLFENKKCGWLHGIFIGLCAEVFHMLILFLFRINDAANAFNVIYNCAPLMIGMNSASVALALHLVNVSGRKKNKKLPKSVDRIAQSFQKGLLICVVLSFLVTNIFITILQEGIAKRDVEEIIKVNIEDIMTEIEISSGKNLLDITRKVASDIEEQSEKDMEKVEVWRLLNEFPISEVDIINEQGIIVNSSNPIGVGFNMYGGQQSTDLIDSLKEYNEYVQKYQPTADNITLSKKYAGKRLSNGYFVVVAYFLDAFHRDVASIVTNALEYRHLDKSGFLLIANEAGEILTKSKDYTATNLLSFGISDIYTKKQNEYFVFNSNGKTYCSMYREVEGFYIIGCIKYNDAFFSRNISVYITAFMEILMFAVLYIVIFFMIKRKIVKNMHQINDSLGKITKGNLGEVVNVREFYEFDTLSDDINLTVDTLKNYITAAEERMKKDLDFAKTIQSSSLPTIFYPKRPDFKIYATMDTAKEVGGDFYDFYFANYKTLYFLIADVSGKGIPAAMFMMRAKTMLKSLAETHIPIDEVVINSNNRLCEGNDAEMFVTSWIGQINLETGVVDFINAGHNPPLVKHKDSTFEYLKAKSGLVLAGMSGVKYKKQQITLQPGDIIYLYTDGVTEATDAHDELYGEDRLQQILNSREYEDMQDLCKSVKQDVDKFVGEAPQFDDITMLALKYLGQPEKKHKNFENAKIDDIPVITEFIDAELEKIDCPVKIQCAFDVAVDEIYSNIVKFAYRRGKKDIPAEEEVTGPASVIFEEVDNPKGVVITFVDSGIPYNPLHHQDPDTKLSAEERDIGGLGIYMVKKSMDSLYYEYRDEQNRFSIRKNF